MRLSATPGGARSRAHFGRYLRLPTALALAFVAQWSLDRHAHVAAAIGVYLAAGALMGWAFWSGDLHREDEQKAAETPQVPTFRPGFLVAGSVLGGLSWWTAGGNTFGYPTILFGVAALLTTSWAFWVGEPPGARLARRARRLLKEGVPAVRVDRFRVLFIGALGLAAAFRFGHLAEVPYEMWSDHAEKYLDIIDVLEGEHPIFFFRNGGREPIQFYLSAAAIRWLDADFSFLTLKWVTASAGFLALPFIYLFGREVDGRGTGLGAVALAGIGYWPNILSRTGLRLPFYLLFLAPAMYYLVRGLRRREQNAFVLCGLFVGLGVYGYTAARIVPLWIAVAVGLYLAHRASRGHHVQAVRYLTICALVAILVSLPFLRVAFEFPDEVFHRTMTRLGSAERPLPGPALEIFLTNMGRALRMFSWDFGEIWVLAIPSRGALGWVTGALFHLGAALLVVRYARHRSWVDLLLLISVPTLLLPSVLSLAFPGENPHPARAAGAIVPVFTIAGITLMAVWSWSRNLGRRPLGWAAISVLVTIAATTNHDLAIRKYGEIERRLAWNTTEAGAVAKDFASSVGSLENVYVVGHPHWMDSRLVALIAGRPGGDLGLWPEQISALPEGEAPLLFLLHPEDRANLIRLQSKYPGSRTTRYLSEVAGRDFLMLRVPARPNATAPRSG